MSSFMSLRIVCQGFCSMNVKSTRENPICLLCDHLECVCEECLSTQDTLNTQAAGVVLSLFVLIEVPNEKLKLYWLESVYLCT